eukprot:GHVT01002786.1.p1 GENE.GHVT01002786.1~~GHVT01002786.1.p1  ORF type:complete len:148 (+),score=31.09 GHVT01002786.1:350-793(+)
MSRTSLSSCSQASGSGRPSLSGKRPVLPVTRWVDSASSFVFEIASLPACFAASYAKMPRRIRLLDAFLCFLLLLAAAQTLYLLLVGSFPFNSFISGIVATLGTFTLSLALRMQLWEKKTFQLSEERVFADYLICCAILFIGVFTFIG